MPVATLTAEFDRLIQVGPARYTYYLRLREDAARLRQLLAGLEADRFILLTDKKVPARHLARMHARLRGAGASTACSPKRAAAAWADAARRRASAARCSSPAICAPMSPTGPLPPHRAARSRGFAAVLASVPADLATS